MMRSRLKRLWNNRTLILILLVWSVQPVSAQEAFSFKKRTPPDMEDLIEAREVFEYEVSYGFITLGWIDVEDRKSTRLNSSHVAISYAVFCLNKKTQSLARSS